MKCDTSHPGSPYALWFHITRSSRNLPSFWLKVFCVLNSAKDDQQVHLVLFFAWAPLAFADFIKVFKNCLETCLAQQTLCLANENADQANNILVRSGVTGCVGIFESCKIPCYQMATREGAWDNKQCREFCAADQITCTATEMQVFHLLHATSLLSEAVLIFTFPAPTCVLACQSFCEVRRQIIQK